MKRFLAFLFLALMLIRPASAMVISSSTSQGGALPSLLLFPGESLTYDLSGQYTGLCQLEVSRDGVNYAPLAITGTSSNTVNGVVQNDSRAAFVRWNVITRTAGTFATKLTDNDDFNREEVGHKKTSVLKLYDDSVRFPTNMVYEPGDTIAFSSGTLLDLTDRPGTFRVLTSTGGPLVLNSVPAISTVTATAGQIVIIQSSTNTLTFQDDGTLSGSALELGAATRALGVGDILVLIYRASKWWEMGFYNN